MAEQGDADKFPYLLIRHGYSLANQISEEETQKVEHKTATQTSFVVMRADATIFDAPIVEKGEQQAISQQPVINQLKVKTVFISPLRRALQTCRLLFAEHPKKSEIHYKVLPMLSEIYYYSSCISDGIEQMKREFSEINGAKVDFSLWEQYNNEANIFQILQLSNHQKREEILQLIRTSTDYDEQKKIIIQWVKDHQPEKPELWLEIVVRVRGLNKFLAEFLQTYQLEKDEKIVIVAHKAVFQCLHFQRVQENGRIICSKQFENAEIHHFAPRDDKEFELTLNQ